MKHPVHIFYFLILFLINGNRIHSQETGLDTLPPAPASFADTLSIRADSLVPPAESDSVGPPPEKQSSLRTVENRAFGVGEHLFFEVDVGVLNAGTATMSIPDTQWVSGRPCYHIVTMAKSNKTLSRLFKVKDRIESLVDIDGIFPWRFEKHIREGRYKADRTTVYDQINHKAVYKKDTLDVPPFVQGILSSFYYVRTLPLTVGEHFNIDNFGDGKMYPLRILVHKKDRVKVPAGVFDCIIVEPVLREEGIFNQKGRMAIWLTDDERRIPVLMKSKILIGTVDVRLVSFNR